MLHVLVLGQSHLALRLGEWVRTLGMEATLAPMGPLSAPMAAAWRGYPRLEGAADDPELLKRDVLDHVQAVFFCASDDGLNLDLALRVRELHPTIRLVLSFRNPDLGRKLEAELGNCAVVSVPEASAPAIAVAALHRGVLQAIQHEGRTHCILRPLEGDAWPRFIPMDELAPSEEEETPVQRIAEWMTRPSRNWDRFLLGILGAIALLLTFATAYFHFSQGLSWITAFYFVVTTFCTVGYGDFSLREASDLAKLAGIALMLGSVTLTAGLFAILTNALVQKRADALEGRRRYRFHHHILVCGLGVMGLRVATFLKGLGHRVLVIEKDRTNPLLPECASRGIPYMVADATHASALRDANLPKARTLVSTLNDDLVGLEIALAGRALCPALRGVLRVCDGAFAGRIERAFRIHTALSSSALAAPAFLARALDPDGLTFMETEGCWWLVRSLPEGAKPGEGERVLAEGARKLVLSPWKNTIFNPNNAVGK